MSIIGRGLLVRRLVDVAVGRGGVTDLPITVWRNEGTWTRGRLRPR